MKISRQRKVQRIRRVGLRIAEKKGKMAWGQRAWPTPAQGGRWSYGRASGTVCENASPATLKPTVTPPVSVLGLT